MTPYFKTYVKNGLGKWELTGQTKFYSLSGLDHEYGLELTKNAGYFGYGIKWNNSKKGTPLYEMEDDVWLKREENF